MKKTLLTLALVAIAASSSFAQGIIALGNSALTKVSIVENGVSRFATAADGLRISVFFGPANSAADALVAAPTSDAAIGSTAGVLVGTGLGAFGLPGTEGGQTVSVQIRATAGNGLFVGQTKVAQVALTAAPSSGAVIWQTASGTVASRFTPLTLTVVPEPSTIALGVLGLGSLLLFRRRK